MEKIPMTRMGFDGLDRELRQLKGVVIPPGSWDWSAVPEHLRMHFQVRDSRNRILGEGEDLEHLQVALRDQVRAQLRDDQQSGDEHRRGQPDHQPADQAGDGGGRHRADRRPHRRRH